MMTGPAAERVETADDPVQGEGTRGAPRESDLRLHALVEESFDVVLVVQADGTLTYVSSAIRATAGYEPQELVGSNFLLYVHPDDTAMAQRWFAQALRSPDLVIRGQLRYRQQDGRWRYADAVSRSLMDHPGVGGIVAILRDATDRTLAEQSRRASEARLNTLMEQSSDVILLTTPDGRVEYAGAAVAEATGYQGAEIIGKSVVDFVHPDDRAAAAAAFADVAEGRSDGFRAVWRCRHKDGQWRIHEVIGRDGRGVPGVPGLIVTCRDVTERRVLDQARRDGDAMLLAIARSARDAIVLVGNDGRIAFWNDGASVLYGWSEREALGADFIGLVPKERRQRVLDDFRQVRETGRSALMNKTLETIALTNAGEQVPVEMTLTPVNLKDQWNVLLIVRSIAERRLAAAERETHEGAIRRSLVESIEAIAATLEARDPYTAGHARRVSALCVAIATRLGYTEDRICGLRLAAQVHDIGKISIPAEILCKPGRLSEIELRLVQTHSQAGYDILRNVQFPWPIAEIVRQHHERLDGSGYPRGLKATEILPEAKILAVADVVESMVQHRPYRAAMGMEAALTELSGGRGARYDARVVDVCTALFREQGYAFGA
ncbi:MAG: PAS domain S-box protein [Nevskia sp.]|nr:PAS domain S-box protein [Nevskia sp.]